MMKVQLKRTSAKYQSIASNRKYYKRHHIRHRTGGRCITDLHIRSVRSYPAPASATAVAAAVAASPSVGRASSPVAVGTLAQVACPTLWPGLLYLGWGFG